MPSYARSEENPIIQSFSDASARHTLHHLKHELETPEEEIASIAAHYLDRNKRYAEWFSAVVVDLGGKVRDGYHDRALPRAIVLPGTDDEKAAGIIRVVTIDAVMRTDAEFYRKAPEIAVHASLATHDKDQAQHLGKRPHKLVPTIRADMGPDLPPLYMIEPIFYVLTFHESDQKTLASLQLPVLYEQTVRNGSHTTQEYLEARMQQVEAAQELVESVANPLIIA